MNPAYEEWAFVLLGVWDYLGAVAETHEIPIDLIITRRSTLIHLTAEAFPKRGEQILDLTIIDRRRSSHSIFLGMVLGLSSGGLGNRQVILLEIF